MLGMLGLAFAVTIGGITTVFAVSSPAVDNYSGSMADGTMNFLGHITLTTTDENGNIKSYYQTDNIIVNRGENCVAEVLFNVTTSGINRCENGLSADGYNFIAIGEATMYDLNGLAEPAKAGNEFLEGEVNRTKSDTPVVVSAVDASGTTVTLSAVFDATQATIVNESGLFDRTGTDTGNMLARQTFANQTLSGADKLTVQWDITIGS